MLSPKVKIGLLVAAHVVGGPLLVLMNRPTKIAIIGLLALSISDLGLLGMWAVLGATRFECRVPPVIVASGFLWVVLPSIVVHSSIVSPGLLLLTLVSATVAVVVVLSYVRHSRKKVRMINLAVELPTPASFQFSIRHLFLATAIVAIVLGIRPGLLAILWQAGQAGYVNMTIAVCGVLSSCTTLVSLATLWAALGIGRAALRCAVVIPAAFIVVMIPIFYWGVQNELQPSVFVAWSMIIGLQAIITAASLLVVRSCGWRLVSGAGLPADGRGAP